MYRILAFTLVHGKEKLFVSILEAIEDNECFWFVSLMWIGLKEVAVYRSPPNQTYLLWDKDEPEESFLRMAKHGLKALLHNRLGSWERPENQWMFALDKHLFCADRWSQCFKGRRIDVFAEGEYTIEGRYEDEQ